MIAGELHTKKATAYFAKENSVIFDSTVPIVFRFI